MWNRKNLRKYYRLTNPCTTKKKHGSICTKAISKLWANIFLDRKYQPRPQNSSPSDKNSSNQPPATNGCPIASTQKSVHSATQRSILKGKQRKLQAITQGVRRKEETLPEKTIRRFGLPNWNGRKQRWTFCERELRSNRGRGGDACLLRGMNEQLDFTAATERGTKIEDDGAGSYAFLLLLLVFERYAESLCFLLLSRLSSRLLTHVHFCNFTLKLNRIYGYSPYSPSCPAARRGPRGAHPIPRVPSITSHNPKLKYGDVWLRGLPRTGI